jgi:hypothetical protein
MATTRQIQAARENIKKAQLAAARTRAGVHLNSAIRVQVAVQGGHERLRDGAAGRALEARNPQQLYALAQECHVSGRSEMGKDELIAAIRRAR